MAQKKKDFTAVAATALEDKRSTTEKIIAPQPTAEAPAPAPRDMTPREIVAMFEGLPQKHLLYTNSAGDEVRVTFMLTAEHYAKLRQLCHAANTKQKHVVAAALRMYFADWEAKNGKLL